MEYISAEEFIKQSTEVQKVLRDWWKPQMHDLFFRNFGYNPNHYLNGIYEGCIQDKEVLHNAVNDKSFLPLFTEGQLRQFIDDKTGGIIGIKYLSDNVWWIIADETYRTETDNLLYAYWELSCKLAMQ